MTKPGTNHAGHVAPTDVHTGEGKAPYYGVMIGMLCLLLVFSVVQMVQITAHQREMGVGGAASGAAAFVVSKPKAPLAPVATPRMVGGC